MIWRIMTCIGSSPISWVIGDQLDPVLGELTDIELKLEVVAEKKREKLWTMTMSNGEVCWCPLRFIFWIRSSVVGGDAPAST